MWPFCQATRLTSTRLGTSQVATDARTPVLSIAKIDGGLPTDLAGPANYLASHRDVSARPSHSGFDTCPGRNSRASQDRLNHRSHPLKVGDQVPHQSVPSGKETGRTETVEQRANQDLIPVLAGLPFVEQ